MMYLPERKNKRECCGCGVCLNVCPVGAIVFKEDEIGFRYPQIDKEKCIGCHMCENICPFDISKDIMDDYSAEAWAAKNKDENVRSRSRSGGVFTAISDVILQNDGSVYGCILDDKFDAVHVRAVTQKERDLFRGSKYVQSDISDIFESIQKDLEDGRQVMFSGTTCQVAAIQKYISSQKLNSDNCFLIDIVCHGVPSSRVFRDYLEYIESKHHCKVIGFDFRNKSKYGWKKHVETIITDKGDYDKRYFKTLFYSHNILRDSCFSCPYRDTVRSGDISLADFWGIENVAPELDDNKGTSLVLIHTNKGRRLFYKCIDSFDSKKVSVQQCLQPPLKEAVKVPDEREMFLKNYSKKGFKWAIWYVHKAWASMMLKRIIKK